MSCAWRSASSLPWRTALDASAALSASRASGSSAARSRSSAIRSRSSATRPRSSAIRSRSSARRSRSSSSRRSCTNLATSERARSAPLRARLAARRSSVARSHRPSFSHRRACSSARPALRSSTSAVRLITLSRCSESGRGMLTPPEAPCPILCTMIALSGLFEPNPAGRASECRPPRARATTACRQTRIRGTVQLGSLLTVGVTPDRLRPGSPARWLSSACVSTPIWSRSARVTRRDTRRCERPSWPRHLSTIRAPEGYARPCCAHR
jgi:hypothetical protein